MRKIRIGKRNIKTAISVFLAISLYLILLLIDRSNNLEADGFSGLSGMYTPFFAGIAAAYTSHKDYKSSLKQAQIRSLGSVVGGYFGMIIILLVELLFKNIFTIPTQSGFTAMFTITPKTAQMTVVITPAATKSR